MDLEHAGQLLAASVRMGTPLLYLSLAELLAERSGVVNVGLEGLLLIGCFASVCGAVLSGSALIGTLIAILASSVLMMGFALVAVVLRQNQVLVGTAINLLALGLSGTLFRAVFGVTGTVLAPPEFGSFRLNWLESVPLLGPALCDQAGLAWGALLLVPLVGGFLRWTVPGVALEAAGQLPKAAEAEGYSVLRIRLAALAAGGVLCGLAGAQLALVHAHGFVEGMSAGRGFIALAIVIFGRWQPLGVLGASLFFGLAWALQYSLQAQGHAVPYQLVRAVPYGLTLLVLAIAGGGARKAPAALGKPVERE